MKIKKEYIILLLIIIALCVYLFSRNSDRTHYQLPEFSELESSNITKIEITKEGQGITLIKKDNQWYLEPPGYLADTDKVNSMLTVFANLSVTALVSESEDYQRYDLHPAKRITVKAWQTDALARNFDIGKAAASFRHTFVRLSDDSRVFQATDNFRGRFEQTTDNLRDRKVLSFKAADIHKIQMTKDRVSVELVRGEVTVKPTVSPADEPQTAQPAGVKYEWQDRNGKKVNDQDLNRLLTTLSSLKCNRYIDGRTKESFSEPIYTVKLKGIGDHQLEVFAKLQKDDPDYPAVSSGSDYPFLLTDSQVQQIMINPAEMLKEPEMDEQTAETPKTD